MVVETQVVVVVAQMLANLTKPASHVALTRDVVLANLMKLASHAVRIRVAAAASRMRLVIRAVHSRVDAAVAFAIVIAGGMTLVSATATAGAVAVLKAVLSTLRRVALSAALQLKIAAVCRAKVNHG